MITVAIITPGERKTVNMGTRGPSDGHILVRITVTVPMGIEHHGVARLVANQDGHPCWSLSDALMHIVDSCSERGSVYDLIIQAAELGKQVIWMAREPAALVHETSSIYDENDLCVCQMCVAHRKSNSITLRLDPHNCTCSFCVAYRDRWARRDG